MTRSSSVVVTAARNEAAVIGHALQAVTAQTVLPVRWSSNRAWLLGSRGSLEWRVPENGLLDGQQIGFALA